VTKKIIAQTETKRDFRVLPRSKSHLRSIGTELSLCAA